MKFLGFTVVLATAMLAALPCLLMDVRGPNPARPGLHAYQGGRDWLLVRPMAIHDGHAYSMVEVVHEGVKYYFLQMDGVIVELRHGPQFPEEAE